MIDERSVQDERRSSRRRHMIGFAAIVLLAVMLVAMTINAFYASSARRDAERWQLHTMEVLLTTEQLRSSMGDSLREERTYMLTGEQRALQACRRAIARSSGLSQKLQQLTKDNQLQVAALTVFPRQLREFHAALDTVIAGGRADATSVLTRGLGRHALERVLVTLAKVEGTEQRLLAIRTGAYARATGATDLANYGLVALGIASLIVVAWAGITASRARMRTLKLEARLRQLATTDELTGLVNRRAFLQALEIEIARAQRSGAPLALAVLDLDHFKTVNDRFGHAGGDDVLRRFADVARETTRAADVIGRIGGEEFALLMPDTDRVQSGIAAERLREAVARRHFVTSTGALVPTTISVGVAHYIAGEDRDQLIVRADEALYDAKHEGRNRTRLAA